MTTNDRRVLLFTSTPLEGNEGADKQLAATIADNISRTDYTWFTQRPTRGRPRLDHGTPVRIRSRDGVPRLRERVRVTVAGGWHARRVDLVHAVLTIGSGYPSFSRFGPRLFAGRPVIHTVPGIMDPRLLRHARPLGMTVALSEPSADLLRQAGFPDVRVIRPTIPLDSWPRRARSTGPPTVLFAGHHDRGGGVVEAIEAAAAAREVGADFRLVLAMRTRPGEDERALTVDLTSLAHRAGLDDPEIHGHVTDMPDLLASADVVLYTPRNPTGKADVPLVVLEALATGRPVIVSDLPHFDALGDAVFRAPIRAAAKAGGHLARLLADPALWATQSDRGWLAAQQFGPAEMVARYDRLYDEVLARSKRAGNVAV